MDESAQTPQTPSPSGFAEAKDSWQPSKVNVKMSGTPYSSKKIIFLNDLSLKWE